MPRFWEALIYNWLIGNCDAHAKNFSLLYDGRAPALAPLYDLVSTSLYGDLTTRLAMSVGDARDLGEVDEGAWIDLARSVGLSERYARSTIAATAERVVSAAKELVETSPHQNDHARDVYEGIVARGVV